MSSTRRRCCRTPAYSCLFTRPQLLPKHTTDVHKMMQDNERGYDRPQESSKQPQRLVSVSRKRRWCPLDHQSLLPSGRKKKKQRETKTCWQSRATSSGSLLNTVTAKRTSSQLHSFGSLPPSLLCWPDQLDQPWPGQDQLQPLLHCIVSPLFLLSFLLSLWSILVFAVHL